MYQIGFVCQNKEQADRLRKVVHSFFLKWKNDIE